MTLHRVTLRDAGLELARVGFGCASLMQLPSRRERQLLLHAAFDHGFTHYDVARMYGLGAAEGEVGRFARGRRDQITIATKFGIAPSTAGGAMASLQAPARWLLRRVPAVRRAVKRRGEAFNAPRRYDAAGARRSLDKSLAELGVDYVDILFVHDPRPHDDVRTEELVAFFNDAHTAGKIRAWGVSQDQHAGLDIVGRMGREAVLQIRGDIFDRVPVKRQSIAFGVLGAAHARIDGALGADSQLLRRWRDRLEFDPTVGDSLAMLLLADAFAFNGNGVTLFSTTRRYRMATASRALSQPPDPQILHALHELIAQSTRDPES